MKTRQAAQFECKEIPTTPLSPKYLSIFFLCYNRAFRGESPSCLSEQNQRRKKEQGGTTTKMLRFRSQAFLLLPAFLVIFSTFFSFSHGVSQLHHLQTTPITGVMNEEYGGLVSWWTRPVVEETNANISSLVLAKERTYRTDPLDGYRHYTGGWNISEEHYWASVGFTAAPLFAIAAIWFVVFGLCLLLMFLYFCCCHRRPYGYSQAAYACSLIFLILFTIAAILGCIILYTGQSKFHSSTTNTLDYVVNLANTIANDLRNVSDYLSDAKKIGVNQAFLPSDIQTKIDDVGTKVNFASATLEEKTLDNSYRIQNVLDTVRLVLIILSAVMLLLAFLGFLFSILGMQCLVSVLVVIGWILVTATFILSGTFLLLHNVAGDTCVAMAEWVTHPTAHTALDDILPCVDEATANETLIRTKEVTIQLVNMINAVITSISNVNFSPNLRPLYFNQSGPLMPLLCNPFLPDFTDRQCATGEVDLNNATQVWKNYECQVSSDGICTTVGRITPEYYNQMAAAVNVSFGLNHYGPFLVHLVDCGFVRDTFQSITTNHCPGLSRYSEWIYVGLVMVSVAVMLSLIFWVVYARERRHRAYTKQVIVRSGGYYDDKFP
ncbi:PREDICTED: uncharacterized protein LOC104588579 [Nelumbo nucifera]|uniref:Uncharacterized protein LOC104588579 n=2 Tax=Nelumbo nucifera TaxID=4432 RepID=A0A1U7Z2J9_NELNU|nr:PREDICTED: uncharacterized protein LOC104588579 [Nelumbo nucifera]XP_010244872.2 PREDICTED: uncharacterized protein LOC104588579 [Nelumbo nucifera]XP_010244873.2 PREDICTED: uncharacterized protein LOC104588579 [Nelumbo nucifera]XP_019051721.1 PREDICTED: uncharacterized protein LOC104588579 [Nelumbo nucifera]DAD27299.1 TPA_asm: hypothetical protein HUJ06_028767 [Nelumbo nucifera]